DQDEDMADNMKRRIASVFVVCLRMVNTFAGLTAIAESGFQENFYNHRIIYKYRNFALITIVKTVRYLSEKNSTWREQSIS
ncbi:unnamed protein product, partial [Heterotrigona itama]